MLLAVQHGVLGNRLLDNLPSDVRDGLHPQLERIPLALGSAMIAPREPIKRIFFPINCLGSLVTVLEDGATIEAGSVGREGMVGIPVVLGAVSTPMQTLTQIAGDAWAIGASAFKEAFHSSSTLQLVIHRYIHTVFVVASQSAACNRRHHVGQRLARWLLMSSDGVGSNELAITQEFLAAMLGVRRAGVTEAAVKLQEEGMIRYTRGFVEILDRPRLESTSCECYRMVANEYERLFG
ncbi:MAG TPA: Crp/Fnr family transcriptional regulator [Thermoanaerobaculia bacterium]|jgi:CRP-like cAMP-binding protein